MRPCVRAYVRACVRPCVRASGACLVACAFGACLVAGASWACFVAGASDGVFGGSCEVLQEPRKVAYFSKTLLGALRTQKSDSSYFKGLIGLLVL